MAEELNALRAAVQAYQEIVKRDRDKNDHVRESEYEDALYRVVDAAFDAAGIEQIRDA